MRSRVLALTGSAAFLIIAPGTGAGYLPWLITRWRFDSDFGDSSALRTAGLVLIAIGAAALLECFFRFAWVGIGTPPPAG